MPGTPGESVNPPDYAGHARFRTCHGGLPAGAGLRAVDAFSAYGSIFPGFIRFSGSRARLTWRITDTASLPCSRLRNPILP